MSKEEIRKWNEWQIVVGAEEIHSIQKSGDGDQLLLTLLDLLLCCFLFFNININSTMMTSDSKQSLVIKERKESDGETGAVFWYKTLILEIIQNPEAKIERPRLGNSPR